MIDGVTSLTRSNQPEDSVEGLRSRASALEDALTRRLKEIARAQASLEAFRIRYRQDVGALYDELEELEREIAEAELGEMSRRLEEEAPARRTSATGDATADNAPRYTTDAVRRLFRDVAKAIHPDLAHGDDSRDRRHSLMVEANRAYELGDEARLRSILHAWEHSPEAVLDGDPEAARLRLVRRIAEIEEELAACDNDLATMLASPLGQLKAMVDDAATRGKDLIADNIRRLKRDVIAARNRRDASLWNP